MPAWTVVWYLAHSIMNYWDGLFGLVFWFWFWFGFWFGLFVVGVFFWGVCFCCCSFLVFFPCVESLIKNEITDLRFRAVKIFSKNSSKY